MGLLYNNITTTDDNVKNNNSTNDNINANNIY